MPTPWMGVWERINIIAYMIWIVVLAILLLRAPFGTAAKICRRRLSVLTVRQEIFGLTAFGGNRGLVGRHDLGRYIVLQREDRSGRLADREGRRCYDGWQQTLEPLHVR